MVKVNGLIYRRNNRMVKNDWEYKDEFMVIMTALRVLDVDICLPGERRWTYEI